MAADKTCEQRISEVLSSTRVKSAALEKEHEAQVSDLKSAISRLRVCCGGFFFSLNTFPNIGKSQCASLAGSI